MGARPPELTVVADPQALAEAAAARVLTRLATGGSQLAVCLTGGSTPAPLYRLLAAEPYRSAVPWSRVHWFWGDERLVPPNDSRSNSGMARRLLLDHVPVDPGHIHPVPTGAGGVEGAARIYEGQLRDAYGAERLDPERPLFDVVLMGIGADGHTASLFPGHPEVDERERWVVGVPEAGLEPFVPRVTLTLPTLASTREMLFLVSGHGKRNILARALSGADLPATRAYSQGDLVWLADRQAAPEGRGAP